MINVKELESVQGIYKIKCHKNNKNYIGQSVDIRKRAFEHIRELKRNNHNNLIIQHAFNKYGIESFKFEIVEVVHDRELLTRQEAFWADYYDTFSLEKGFNINPIEHNQANDAGNIKHAKLVYGTKNGNSKLNDKDVIEICNILNEDYEKKEIVLTKLGKKYNVRHNAIANIRDGRTWGHLTLLHLREEIIEEWPKKHKKKWFNNEKAS